MRRSINPGSFEKIRNAHGIVARAAWVSGIRAAIIAGIRFDRAGALIQRIYQAPDSGGVYIGSGLRRGPGSFSDRWFAVFKTGG